jgi:hypothetical protein
MTPTRTHATSAFLAERRVAIVDVALAELNRRRIGHYASSSIDEVRLRLDRLYDLVIRAAETGDLGEVVAYAERLAAERYHSGYGLNEVQAACNVLEESVWTCVFAELNPSAHAAVLSVVSSILGAAKDALARRYVELATRMKTPALDVAALFTGTERG